jgi:hypothetical protein
MIIGLPQSMIIEVLVPVVPSCLLEPAWVEFSALLDERRGGAEPEFHPGHPLGCHRRRAPGRVVFEHVVAALVHGSGYERIATPGCSDRTIRRRLAAWAEAGLGEALHAAQLGHVLGTATRISRLSAASSRTPLSQKTINP